MIQHHVPGPSSRRRPSPVAAPRRVRVHPRRFSGRCAIRRTPRRVAARERSRCVTDARGRGRRDDRRARADAVRRASDARAGDWLGADESAVTRRLGRIRRRFDAGRRRCGRGGARGGVDAAGTGPRVGGRTRGRGRGRIASREIERAGKFPTSGGIRPGADVLEVLRETAVGLGRWKRKLSSVD